MTKKSELKYGESQKADFPVLLHRNDGIISLSWQENQTTSDQYFFNEIGSVYTLLNSRSSIATFL